MATRPGRPMRTFLKSMLVPAAFAMAALFARGAVAGSIDVTPEEMALLPKYCPDTMAYAKDYMSYPPNVQRWRGAMGPDFDHMHHYCWGLARVVRVDRATNSRQWPKARRESMLSEAAGEFQYVIRNSSPGFVMLPEVYVKLGAVFARLHRDGEAVAAFRRAIEAKQDYAPAYLKFGEMLYDRGNVQEARKVVEAGLTSSPDSKSLKALMAELNKGGASAASGKQGTQAKASSRGEP